MCGIIAVVRRRARRTPPDPAEVLALLGGLRPPLAAGVDLLALEATLAHLTEPLEEADRLLRGVPGTRCLIGAPDLVAAAERVLGDLHTELARVEALLDGEAGAALAPNVLERTNAALIR